MPSTIPMVSVLMPAFNAEKHVARAIRSVVNQKFVAGGYELIVVNDGSEDRTLEALQPFSDDIRLFSNDVRRGLPSCLNQAIRAARGKYIVRVDADDYVTSDYIYILQRFLEANHDMDAAACDYLEVDDSEQVLRRKSCSEHPIGCGIMFRVDYLIDVGMYDSDFLMHEDADLRIRFLRKYNIARIELPLYRYRQHTTNMTNDVNTYQFYKDRLVVKHGSKDAQ